MFSRAFKALHCHLSRPAAAHASRTSRPQLRPGRLCSTGAAQGAFSVVQSIATRIGLTSGGVLLGGGGVLYAQSNQASNEQPPPLATSQVPWVQDLADRAQEVQSPGQLLRKNPVAKLLIDVDDHLFETMTSSNQIHEFRCFYDKKAKQFHSVVQLGKDVCGFPQTVHGGLTAAIIDETFGGLGVCLWKTGALGVRPPAYTARLEVDYKKKLPAGSLILVSTHLERVSGRKVWMTAQVSNGQGQVFATARALFVAPRMPGESLALGLGSWFQGLRGARSPAKTAGVEVQAGRLGKCDNALPL
ncbi:HotDog domain-containing protein [Haematococcus lacustris]